MKPILLLSFLLWIVFLKPAVAQMEVKGEVKDNQGVPLAGATAVIKGTNSFAISDANGRFSLGEVEKLPFSLQFKYVGFKTAEILISEPPTSPLKITLEDDNLLSEFVVSSRRREEAVQDVPIPITVLGGVTIAEAGAFNVNRLKEMVPSVQLYSSNPRNTTLNIRGLGSTFGLTNDGVDPGVGFYVDGVYYARPAVTSLDFIDVDQIEVLRGPQGTLFGKNTTAGAFNITTKKPSFTAGANFELSFGNYGFVQAKSSVTGPLGKKIAARLSFSVTRRDGLIDNVATAKAVNDLNSLGLRGQVLFTPTPKLDILLTADATRQRPNGYAQVIAGMAPTMRPDYRQFEQIIADLDYTLPSRNPFDRIIDHDTPWKSNQDIGGISVNVNSDLGGGTLTSTTALRYWNWNPSNDRDFTGLPVLTLSQAPSRHDQWSQEVRWAGNFNSKLSGVFGVFYLGQKLNSSPYHTEESGSAQWRFSQNTSSPLWQTPGLFEGYGIRTYNKLISLSSAVFGQLDWAISDRLHLLPGIRINYDEKKVAFQRKTYGGLFTQDPEILVLKQRVYNDQAFETSINDTNFSGQLTLAYKAADRINTFATYANSYKPVGLNLGGLPTVNGAPAIELAMIRPEEVHHLEFGVKTNPTSASNLNFTIYNTAIKDYQTLVQTAELGVNRGYLSNAEKVNVRGVELDGNLKLNRQFSIYGAMSYTQGIYVTFENAPVPLEETGGEAAFKDISGEDLPGISKWASSFGGEASTTGRLFGGEGKFLVVTDVFYRSSFSSSASPSQYLVIDGYSIVNTRAGFRGTSGISIFIWARNLLNKDYLEQLLPAGGNAGHYAGVLGDQRTFGITLSHAF